MSEFGGSTLYAQEMEQPLTSEATASIVVGQESQYLHESAVDVVNTMPEISESHPEIDIDVEQFSAGALIKVCPHYAKMAEINPELARTQATEVVQRMQERETMQEKGVDTATIKQQQFAAMKARLQAKAKAKEKAVSETLTQERETERVQSTTPEERKENTEATPQSIENKPQSAQKTEIATDQTAIKELQSIPDTKIISEISEPQQTASKIKISDPSDTLQSTPELVPPPVKVEKVEDVIPTHEPLVIKQVDARVLETMPTELVIKPSDMEVEFAALQSTELPLSLEDNPTAQVTYEEPAAMTPNTVSIPVDYYESDHELKAAIEAAQAVTTQAPWQETAPAREPLFDELEPSIEITDTFREQPEIYEPMPEPTHTVAVAESTDTAILPEIEQPETHTPTKVPEMYAPTETVEPEQAIWDGVVEKELLEVCEDFIEALQTIAIIPEQTVILEATIDTDEPIALAESIHEQTPPSTAQTIVAERLTGLVPEEKRALTPLLGKIVEAIQIFDKPANDRAAPEVIQATQDKLTGLVIALFEELDIAYESEDIKYFITILLHPDFQSLHLEESALINLELQGTHEAKSPLTQFVDSSLADIQETSKRLLGKLVLFSHRTVPEYELVA